MNRYISAALAALVLCPALASAGGPPEPIDRAPTFAWGDRGPRAEEGAKIREDAHDIELRHFCDAVPWAWFCPGAESPSDGEEPCPCDETCNDASCGAE